MGGLRIGKVRELQQISTRDGIFAMCAMDHRGSLRWKQEWRHANHNSTLFTGPLSGLSFNSQGMGNTRGYQYMERHALYKAARYSGVSETRDWQESISC